MEQTEKILYAGYSEAKITPPLGMHIPGYYDNRFSEGIITDLYLHAVAFSNGEEKAIFYSCDCISFRNMGYNQLKKMIAERCNIPVGNIYIACTHSHTSFRLVAPEQTDCDTYRIFIERLFLQFCDCAQLAFEDLKPAKLLVAKGEVTDVGFMRRYRMKDGTVKTNPKSASPDILRPEGEQDTSLQLVRAVREGAKEILMVNFGTHADVIGGNSYCADYPGYLSETLKCAFDNRVEVIFFNGCEGDSAHRDAMAPLEKYRKGVLLSQRMGRKLAGEVLKIYDDATPVEGTEIQGVNKIVKIGKNPYDPAMMPIVDEMNQIYLEKGNKAPELANYPISLVEAVRIVQIRDLPEFFEMNLSAVRIGNLAFVGIPGEPFQKIGTDIKEKSGFQMTFVTSCTNGGEENAYFPTADAFAEDGYERKASLFAHNCAQLITDGALDLIENLLNQ